MQILAHRGFWRKEVEKNSPEAFEKALANEFGFESDIRDYLGKLVISHNIADANSKNAEEVFRLLNEYNDKYCFAINIKADGLKELLNNYIERYNISNYFLFDMSVPQMVEFNDMGLKFFTRQSELEVNPCMYEEAEGVWIDGFGGVEWITKELIVNHFRQGKKVCLVSPDLHGNEYKAFWEKLRQWKLTETDLMICTDYPQEARDFFYEK